MSRAAAGVAERDSTLLRAAKAGAIGAALLWGLGQSLWTIWASHFREIPGGLGDARLHHYLLEHFWAWVRSSGPHVSLWSPPFFHPTTNVLAFSEPLFGSALPYVLARSAGAAPVQSFAIWEASLLAFGMIAALWAFRHTVELPLWAAVAGAYVFAFSPLRLGDLSQPQLLGFGFGALAFGAVVAGCKTPDRAASLWSLAAASLVLQLYSSFYLSFFWAAGFASLLVAVALDPGLRRRVFALVVARRYLILGLGLGIVISAVPFLQHYLRSMEEIGPRPFAAIERNWIPAPSDYARPSTAAWLYRSGGNAPTPEAVRTGMNPGWSTVVLAVLGLWGGKSEHRLARRTLLILVASTLSVGGFSFWRSIYELVPGAEAVRAVARVRLVELFPWAIGAALGLRRLQARSTLLAAVALLALVGDQLRSPGGSPWAARLDACATLAREIPPTCDAVLYSPQLEGAALARRDRVLGQVDGMWIGALAGVPSINGHSGGSPRDWSFRRAGILSREDESRLGRALTDLVGREAPGTEVCWVQSPPLDLDLEHVRARVRVQRLSAPAGAR